MVTAGQYGESLLANSCVQVLSLERATPEVVELIVIEVDGPRHYRGERLDILRRRYERDQLIEVAGLRQIGTCETDGEAPRQAVDAVPVAREAIDRAILADFGDCRRVDWIVEAGCPAVDEQTAADVHHCRLSPDQHRRPPRVD